MGTIYWVKVQGLRGETKWIDLCNTDEEFNSMTMKNLKEKIRHCFSYMLDVSGSEGDNHEELQMIFQGLRLEGDDTLLCHYGIQDFSVIQLVLKICGGDPGWGAFFF
uniref:Ubiquitin-like domain-containing protein n=1 Tax=Oreochromis aureus TaxID=47969 RepID=A0A668RL03_OREAU